MNPRRVSSLGVLVLAGALTLGGSARADDVLYASGHPLDGGRLAAFGGHSLVTTFFPNDANWTAALGGAFGPFDAIVVGENQGFAAPLSPPTIAAIQTYVSSGGRILVVGGHGRESLTLNGFFGYGTATASFQCCQGTVIATAQAGVVGTSFDGGPAGLTNLNSTVLLSATPGTTMYAGAGGVAVFVDSFGAGIVGYLGWDYCCGGSSAEVDAWYDVLDRALAYSPAGLEKRITDGEDVDLDLQIDRVVEVGTAAAATYEFTVAYSNPGGPPVVIVDAIPAEWDAALVDDDGGGATLSGANKKDDGKSATKLAWMPDPDGGAIVVRATTRGPKRNGKFAPTSCGTMSLNDGAVALEIDEVSGSPLQPPLFESNTLCLAAVEDLDGGGLVRDGSGDEDGDGLDDLVEACDLRTNPCLADTDGDGLIDGEEAELYATDPLDFDSDDDGLGDGQEILDGTDPNDAGDPPV
jgi:hypothetical protein